MIMMKAASAALLIAVAAAPAGAAEDPWLGCYTRVYDAQHLLDNPGQKIRTVALELTETDLELAEVIPYMAGIVATTTYDDRRYVSGGGCRADGDRLECAMDGDAGRFRLARTVKGLRLENTDGFYMEDLDAEDPSDGLLVEADADHQVFLLYRADPSQCR